MLFQNAPQSTQANINVIDGAQDLTVFQTNFKVHFKLIVQSSHSALLMPHFI